MCCGLGPSSKAAKTITAYVPPAPAKPVSNPGQTTANPFVIPKSIKQQLIVNQQLSRIPKKT